MKLLKDLFTGRDNKTWDLGRIMWAMGTAVYCGISVYSLYQGIAIDPLNWATGFGAILAGGGAALRLKQSDEPNTNPKNEFIDNFAPIAPTRPSVASSLQQASEDELNRKEEQ